MATLKELRINAGLTQPQIAELIRSHVPFISNYENDVALPDLEDAIILEKKFGQRIEWKDDHTPNRKHQIVQSIIELTEHYPLPMVMEFVARNYRRETSADSMIIHYANVSGANDIEPLLPNPI